jgi:hypothetical protein
MSGVDRSGNVTVEVRDGTVEIFGDPAGLRDLARWCLSLSDETAHSGVHVHLDRAPYRSRSNRCH